MPIIMKKADVIFLFMLFLLHCQGQTLLQEGKLWSNTSIGTMHGSTYSSYFIKFMGDTTINGLGYKKIMKSDDALHSQWTLDGCIREEPTTRKVFIFNEYTKKDMLLYDFSLEEGDSILTGDGQSYIKVTKVINATFGSSTVPRKQIYFFDPDGGLQWIEGIGSIWGVLEGLGSFYTTGATLNLVCYSENDQLVYHNLRFSTCFPQGQNVSILDASLKWNIGTHCVNEGPIQPYDKWSTSFLHTEGDTLMNEKHYKKLVSCADSLCGKKSLKSYIREEAGQVFLANKTEEHIRFDFNLQKGDTMIVDFLQDVNRNVRLYIRIDSVKSMVLQDQKRRIAQYITVFDYYNSKLGGMSINDVFVEGIGSLRFGLEYPIGLFITGDQWCSPALLCFYYGEGLIFSNPEINNCYLSTGLLQLQQSKIVQVFANAYGMLEIQLTKANAGKLFVYDLNGKQIFGQAVNHSGTQFCLPSSGIYLYRFESDKGEIQTGKVVVK